MDFWSWLLAMVGLEPGTDGDPDVPEDEPILRPANGWGKWL